MARRASADMSVGERIRVRRQLRGWSIRHAADRAGISHTSWSRIERSLQSADNRFVLASIAQALEVSVGSLSGQSAEPVDADTAAAQSHLNSILQALMETELGEDPVCEHRGIEELERECALLLDLRGRCDYSGVGQRLPGLLRELHSAATSEHRARALRLIVAATHVAGSCVRDTGQPTDLWLTSERCRQAAEASDDPVLLAMAGFERAQTATANGLYTRGVTVATRAAGEIGAKLSAPGAEAIYGTLLLSAAFACRGAGQAAESDAVLAEARALAERTGETREPGLYFFGPSNAAIWSISMDTDGGDPDRAVLTARDTDPVATGSLSRQVTFYVDLGRALSYLGKDAQAVRMLLTAERLSPVRVHSSSVVQETARAMLDRAQRQAGGGELRGLVERMALHV